jgi:hypothetical protein
VDTGCDIAGCYISVPNNVLAVMAGVHVLQSTLLQAAALILWSGLAFVPRTDVARVTLISLVLGLGHCDV